MLKNILTISQTTISLILTVLIVLQAKGVGLGRAWGGGGEFYKSRRGVENIIFKSTIIVAVLFLAVTVLNLAYS